MVLNTTKSESQRLNLICLMRPGKVFVTDLKTGEKTEYGTRIHSRSDLLCMICLETISRTESIWCCQVCRAVTHLVCIKAWSFSRIKPKSDSSWMCPNCRHAYPQAPIDSRCFCGKTVNPEANTKLYGAPPHCCFEICGNVCPNTRGAHCDHPCESQCHSGLCPPCHDVYVYTCWCGRHQKSIKCSEFKVITNDKRSCGEICSNTLNCGLHKCQQVCHFSECAPCSVIVSESSCFCGAKFITHMCGGEESSVEFSCGGICDKILTCKKHRCNSICHPGYCTSCPTDISVIKTCFCGKSSLEELNVCRTDCEEPIPTCTKICGKILKCRDFYNDLQSAEHICQGICHSPPCPVCNGTSFVLCQCKKSKINVNCIDLYYSERRPVLCNKKCKKKLSCGKHKCQEICCSSQSHVCPMPCDQKGPCELHECSRTCHSDPTHKCSYIYNTTVACSCGKTTVPPPYNCSSLFPLCLNYCPRRCKLGHVDNHPCHRMDTKCPPCSYLMTKMCINNHRLVANAPCSAMEVLCMSPCGKIQKCGHSCQKLCHRGDCQQDPKDKCSVACQIMRTRCRHPCDLKCHFPTNCPTSPCLKNVQIYCECKFRTNYVNCEDFSWFLDQIKSLNINFKPKGDHEELCLMCDHDCLMKQRLFQLATAFGIDPLTQSELCCKVSKLSKDQLEEIINTEFHV
ncbi:Transcriptional repressor NF-X1 [Thelohanellus kitauei]|uniref:Transcriptional repressor NF-X1 n=1 Tax=Thelohanellus kitauei TaxID=669202 RepID=A0A0C2MF24_THEKT|nr:Transcriptional repressor NF-X1 [Thelohanellus kitauei]